VKQNENNTHTWDKSSTIKHNIIQNEISIEITILYTSK